MAGYMPDTDTRSYIMKRSNQTVLRTATRGVGCGRLHFGVITKSELLYGVDVSPRREQQATALRAFLPHVEVLEFPMPPRPTTPRYVPT
jgi:predicted nucleic acid-binding protein